MAGGPAAVEFIVIYRYYFLFYLRNQGHFTNTVCLKYKSICEFEFRTPSVPTKKMVGNFVLKRTPMATRPQRPLTERVPTEIRQSHVVCTKKYDY